MAFSEHSFEHFAGCVVWDLVDEYDRLWHLKPGQMFAAVIDDGGFIDGLAVLEDNNGSTDFDPFLIGNANNRHFADLG